jgi:hypothetical protein
VKDSKEDAPTLARRLHVEYLLEGTVRGSLEQLRVSTRLIRAADGFELWSEVFDRGGSEILKLEDDIARAVAADFHLGLDLPAPAMPSTRSLEAYQLLLQARHVWRQEIATGDERALIEAALQKDPGYAHAWVELGSWWYDSMLIGKVIPETAAPKARAAYDRALALDKNSSPAYVLLAWLQMSQLDWVGAQRSIARADTLDPASLSVLTVRGELERSAGRWAQAIRLEHEHLQRDPLSPGTKFVLAQSHLCAGEYANAEEIIKQTIAEDSRYPGAHALLARALAAQGDAASALRSLRWSPTNQRVLRASQASSPPWATAMHPTKRSPSYAHNTARRCPGSPDLRMHIATSSSPRSSGCREQSSTASLSLRRAWPAHRSRPSVPCTPIRDLRLCAAVSDSTGEEIGPSAVGHKRNTDLD